MTRTDILNAIARTIGAQRYCEIGVRNPADNFDLINVPVKIGVDPRPARGDILPMTSDEYFEGNPAPCDLYFIDGLHEQYQALRDFLNAQRRLTPRGVIVMHDCRPSSIEAMSETKPDNGRPWNGTVWRAWLEIRSFLNAESFCVPHDHGCGVAWAGQNTNPAGKWAWVAQESMDYFLRNRDAYTRSATLPEVLAALEART